MVSENIKKLRNEKGITQKELADKLNVTAQAVSRWETGEVEPSIDTLSKMSIIFNVSIDELVGGADKKPEPEIIVEKEYVVQESKPVLAVCEQCNEPIYNSADIVRIEHHRRGRSSSKVICRDCDVKNKTLEKQRTIALACKRRKRSYIWGTVSAVVALAICLIVSISQGMSVGAIIGNSILCLLFFPFVSCLFLDNNFVGDMFIGVCSWGFVKMPGVIFSLDLNGIIWLLTIKLALWVFGIALAIACFFLALALSLVISVFVYPFALNKSIKHPGI